MDRVMKWDRRFLTLASEIATWSKDPSTQVGAVIVRPDYTIASLGFNGFPRSMPDDPVHLQTRPMKYSRTIHAEMNAILTAKEPLYGYTLYSYPLSPCDRCAVHIIQAGIKRVICALLDFGQDTRWSDSCNDAVNYFHDCGVQYGRVLVQP